VKPTIQLPGLTLRPARAGDLASLCARLHLPQVRKYLCDDIVLPRETVAGMLARSRKLDEAGLGLWALETPGKPLPASAASSRFPTCCSASPACAAASSR